MEREVQQVQENCSFQPNIQRLSSAQQRPRSLSVISDRRQLYENERKKEKREKLKREQQDKEMSECTFHPNINRKTSHPTLVNPNKFDQDRVPLHERATEILKRKQDKIQNLRAEQEFDQMDKLFKPQINSKSDKIAQLKNFEQNQKPVSERLYGDAQERVNKLISSST